MGWSTDALGLRRSADTEPDAEEILGANRIDDILYAVVSGRSGRNSCFVCAGCDVEVIVQYGDIPSGEFVEIQESADRAAGAVHESGGLDEEVFLLADGTDGELSVETGLAMEVFEIKMFAEEIKREKAGVVPGGFVLFAGIAETDDESHNQYCYFLQRSFRR